MAHVESFCDSEDEVFFGPVTEKEKKIAENLRRRAMIPRHMSTPGRSSQDDEEGLHTLAMAAQMLSISCNNEDLSESKNVLCDPTTYVGAGPCHSNSVNVERHEGNHLELDAVTFLSQRIPEQNQSGYFVDVPDSGENSVCSVSIHHTSLASPIETNDADNYLNKDAKFEESLSCSLNEPKFTADEKDFKINPDLDILKALEIVDNIKLEENQTYSLNGPKIEVKEEIGEDGAHDPKLEILNAFEGVENAEFYSGTIACDTSLSKVKVDDISWEDANEMSKVEFGLKISDNEEDTEEERNLKVEEIIKFLADEDKPEDDCLGKIKEEDYFPSYQVCGSLESDCLHAEKNGIAERNNVDKLLFDHPPKNEVKCDLIDVDSSPENVSDAPEFSNFSEQLKLDMGDTVSVVDTHEDPIMKIVNGALPSTPPPAPSDCMEEESTKLQLASEMQNDPSPTQSESRIPQNKPSLKKPSLISKYHHTPKSVTKTKEVGTPRPLKPYQSPAPNALPLKSSARSLPQESGLQRMERSSFKTPNSKVKPTGMSKIPHFCSFTPSPSASKKFAGIVSPVSQYIHNKPVLLITNKKPNPRTPSRAKEPVSNACGKSHQSSESSSAKALPDMVGEKGVENVDTNNYFNPPEIVYKSALPVKIISPRASPNCSKTGKTAVVIKHLGHMKMSSAKSGQAVSSLSLDCRESMMPDGEVSLLLSKEVELQCPTSQRN